MAESSKSKALPNLNDGTEESERRERLFRHAHSDETEARDAIRRSECELKTRVELHSEKYIPG